MTPCNLPTLWQFLLSFLTSSLSLCCSSLPLGLCDDSSSSPPPSVPSYSSPLSRSASWEGLSELPTQGLPLHHVTRVRPRPPRRHKGGHIPSERVKLAWSWQCLTNIKMLNNLQLHPIIQYTSPSNLQPFIYISMHNSPISQNMCLLAMTAIFAEVIYSNWVPATGLCHLSKGIVIHLFYCKYITFTNETH